MVMADAQFLEQLISQFQQNNLQNWKQTRKSQSSYQRVQELEEEEEAPRKAKSKTYKEIIEERQRRKSAHDINAHDDYNDGSFEYEPSKARFGSKDDLNEPDGAQEHYSFSKLTSTSKNSTETKNHKDETNGFVAKTEEIRQESAPMTYTELTSDKKSHTFSNSFLHDIPVHGKDAHIDNNALRDVSKSAIFSSNREKFETGNTSSSPSKSVNEVKRGMNGGTNVSDKLKMWNKSADVTPPKRTVEPKKISHVNNEKGNVNSIKNHSSNMFFEKIIRINQRPNHEKGFGFTFTGGREFSAPIVVDKVLRGGSADICELKAGDQIIAINGADVGRHYNKSVQSVLDQAIASGTIELKIKRLKDLEDDFEEDVFSDDEIELAANKRASQFSDSMSSQWSSPPSTPPAMPSVADVSDDLLPPPPLPSIPPPPPNWNTFPGMVASHSDDTPKDDLSFIVDNTSLKFKAGNQNVDYENQSHEIPDVSKEDILRRRSQFLGLKLEESQEFKALQEEKERKSKHGQMSSIDFTNSFSVSHIPDAPLHAPLVSLPDHHFHNKIAPNTKSRDDFLEEEREREKLREKEEQLRKKEEAMRKEEERLLREKERMEQEVKERLSIEREWLQREKKQELELERERLLKEKEQQLHQERERLWREKEQETQRQNEWQLKLEIERLEREKEQQLIAERERLKWEKEKEIQQEKERLQKERERQEKEQAERLRLEEEKRRAEQEAQVRNLSDNRPFLRGFTSNHEPSARNPSFEQSESEVANNTVKVGGKTFARLAAQTRSESLGEFSVPKSVPKVNNGSFLKTEPTFGKSLDKKPDNIDKSARFSSIKSNFEHGNFSNSVASNREQDSASSYLQDQWHPRTHEHFEGAVNHSDQHRSNASLALETKSKNPPQVSLRTTSLTSSYEDPSTFPRPPMERQSALLGSHLTEQHHSQKLRPQPEDRTMSFGHSLNPEISERTTSLQPHFGGHIENENQTARTSYNQKPFEQVTSRPQNNELVTSLVHPFREDKFLHNKTQLDQHTIADLSNQSTHSNVSFLLYGDADETAGKITDGIGSGGYNRHNFNQNIPSSSGLPSFSESRQPWTNNGQQEKSSPRQSGNFPSNSAHPAHQFNESWPSTKSSVPPYSTSTDSNDANQKKTTNLGPRPFESALKLSSGIGDHWLLEEAERRRISELTGEPRAWSMGQDAKQRHNTGSSLNHQSEYPGVSHHTLPNRGVSDHRTVHHDAPLGSMPFNSLSRKSSQGEFLPQKSPRSVPEPVKQTLLTRINTNSSGKSLTPLSPLPSYPVNHSNAHSHSRSVSSPVIDPNIFSGLGGPFSVASHSSMSPSFPLSGDTTSGGAVDSLFAYHQSNPSGTNLVSQQSLSRSHGSLHLDGTPQYTNVRTQRVQVPYTGSFQSGNFDQRSNSYTVFVKDPGRVADSFPQHCQPVVQNLLCGACQRPLREIGGNVSTKGGGLRLRCQYCFHEN